MGYAQGAEQRTTLKQELHAVSPSKQKPVQIKPLDIEEIIQWLNKIWLEDDQLRETIDANDWQEFIEELKAKIEN